MMKKKTTCCVPLSKVLLLNTLPLSYGKDKDVIEHNTTSERDVSFSTFSFLLDLTQLFGGSKLLSIRGEEEDLRFKREHVRV